MEVKMELKSVGCGIYHVAFKNEYFCASTFCRVQEFYESAFKEIRGKYFRLEDYTDLYFKKHETWDYFETVAGCNVPGEQVDAFFDLFDSKGDLMDREFELYKLVKQIKKQPDVIANGGKYYLIATGDQEHVMHEISHGLYYTVDEYREAQDLITSKWKSVPKVKAALLTLGYADLTYIIKDEIQAYFATEKKEYLVENLEYVDSWGMPKGYATNFKKFVKNKKLKIPKGKK